jgi:hypothetical protein
MEKGSQFNNNIPPIISIPPDGSKYVIECATRVGSRMGWTNDFIQIAAIQTLMALICKVFSPNDTSLPPLLDHIWHEMILETDDYKKICDTVFKQFLHHTSKTVSDSIETKNSRIDNLVAIWNVLFKSVPCDTKCWEREQSSRKRSRFDFSFNVEIKRQTEPSMHLVVPHNTTIGALKNVIQTIEGYESGAQRLIHAGTALDDSYIIDSDIVLHLVMRLRGC